MITARMTEAPTIPQEDYEDPDLLQLASPDATAAPPELERPKVPGTGWWRHRPVRILIWMATIVVVVLLSLLASAWISGFRLANGLPDVVAMVRWILANYDVTV